MKLSPQPTKKVVGAIVDITVTQKELEHEFSLLDV
jgi:hypothetical protein